MKEKILFFSIKHPLAIILLLAIVVRGLAAVFSQNYDSYLTHPATLDEENFYYVEVPNAWISRSETPCYDSPQGISLTFLYLNYLVFGALRLLGVHNMHWLLLITRIINGLISLLIITLGYRITKIISNKTTALIVAFMLAFYWFFAVMSVYAMPQIASIPCLLYGTLLIVKQDYLLKINKIDKLHRTTFFISGIFFGLGFALWYQSIIYFIGVIIALLILKNRKSALMTMLGFLLMLLVTQTVPDQIVWKQIFAEMNAFFVNNCRLLDNSAKFTYMYNSVLPFLPLVIIFLFGFFRKFGKNLLITLPTLSYLVICILMPYKTDLNLATVLPMFFIVGFAEWRNLYDKSIFRTQNRWQMPTLYSIEAIINLSIIVISMIFNLTFIYD